MGHLTAELPPQPRNRVQLRTVGGHIPQDQPARRGADHRLDCIIGRGISVIPGPIDRARGLLIDQRLQQLGDLLAPFAAAEQPPGFARVVVDGAQTLPRVRLPWGRKHDLLPPRTPQRA